MNVTLHKNFSKGFKVYATIFSLIYISQGKWLPKTLEVNCMDVNL